MISGLKQHSAKFQPAKQKGTAAQMHPRQGATKPSGTGSSINKASKKGGSRAGGGGGGGGG